MHQKRQKKPFSNSIKSKDKRFKRVRSRSMEFGCVNILNLGWK